MAYTATDEDGGAATLSFTITVLASEGGKTVAEGDCHVGLQVSPGGSCTYPGTDSAFTVDADGRGRFLVVNSTRAINVNNVTYQGTFYDFRASQQSDGVWRIDRIDGSTEVPMTPPSGGGGAEPGDSMPSFAADAGPGDRTFTVGAAIDALSLPAATGGDGTLGYTLAPEVPGLTFDAATRRLTGTPTTAATHNMTYTATDEDGDADTLSFTITVREASTGDTSPEFPEGSRPDDLTYMVDTAIPALTLPAATGGDGTLTYSLGPRIPGLSFDPATRRLTGTPTHPGFDSMTYTVTDEDGDTDTIYFIISVEGDEEEMEVEPDSNLRSPARVPTAPMSTIPARMAHW